MGSWRLTMDRILDASPLHWIHGRIRNLQLVVNNASATGAVTQATLAVLHGVAKLSASSISWSTTDLAANLNKLLGSGGRLLIRLHTGVLLDKQRRAFSAALDALIGAPQPHLPGGVFEGWVMVTAG